tara:strand:- start:122 stop:1330 length:1209 start_codon:yes stop_codon:yes gene_type:complete
MIFKKERCDKKGQAAGTAVLLAIIAGLLIMFIILIPPQERAELLGDDDGTTTVSDQELEEAVPEVNLLTESPGRIDYLAQNEIEHPLPVVNIFTRTESKILAEKNLAYAKRAVFTDETSKFEFIIPDLENSENVLLNFNVKSLDDKLIVVLNEEIIFNSAVEGTNVGPIKLPSNYLQSNNLLVFKASSPGVAFWATNEVELENIKVVADVTSLESQSSKNVFLVSETEKENLEKVVLKFQPTCKYGEVGKLNILVNGEEIYDAVPDCDLAMVPIEFSAELLSQGENEVLFSISKGTYLLSHVVIESDLKKIEYPTYYFELSQEQYELVEDGLRRIRLQIDFVDVVADKFGDLVFNGHIKHFDTQEISFVVDLSDDAVKSNNALKIKPKKTLDVRELKVDLVK